MEYLKKTRNITRCLECGDKITYGRADKKFCCEDCRNSYFNMLRKESRVNRRRVLSILSRNYEILEELLHSGVENLSLVEAIGMGFNPEVMTSCRKVRGRSEFCCFDIRYVLTETRIYSIMKIKNVYVNLHPDPEFFIEEQYE